MTVGERQRRLVEDYSIVADPRERFQLIVETAAAAAPAFPENARVETNLVPGCASRVWLDAGVLADGTAAVWIDSESPALRAIGSLLARVYSGAPPQEILETEPFFIESLGIDRLLTPTRQRSLRRLREGIVAKVSLLAAAGT